MTKRIQSALLGFAVLAACVLAVAPAEARSSYTNGHRHSHSHGGGHGGGTSRACLTSAARALLGRIESQFGAVQIVSTCRPGARIATTGKPSRHASGNAIDFNAGGRKGAIVSWLIANHKSGGTMTYAGMDHIHVDIGPHFVSLAGSRIRTASRSRKGDRWASRRMALGAKHAHRKHAHRNRG